jgi:hypothetical protein
MAKSRLSIKTRARISNGAVAQVVEAFGCCMEAGEMAVRRAAREAEKAGATRGDIEAVKRMAAWTFAMWKEQQ